MPYDAYTLPPVPPVGQVHNPADEAHVYNYVHGLMCEAYEERRQYDDQVDRNANLTLGRFRTCRPKGGIDPVDINRIRNVCIAHVQVQTEQTPRIKLGPRETAEPPIAYLNTQVSVGDLQADGKLRTLFAMLDASALGAVAADGSRMDPQPLSDKDQANVELAIAAGILPAEALVLITDRTAADAEQLVFDEMWDECRADFYVREATYNKTTIGWQFMLYGFDDAKKQHVLYNPSHLLVFIDPTCTDIRDAAHTELLQFLDLNRAKAKYPAYADKLEAQATLDGNAVTQGDFPFRIPRIYQSGFQRRMVAVRHCWIRDWPFPLTREEALAGGHIAQSDEPVAGNGDNATPEEAADDTAPLVNGAEPADLQSVSAAADVAPPPAAVPAPTRVVLRNLRGDELTDETSAGWPTRPGIREICIVGENVLSDRESEFGDIPLAHMVNLPIPFSPFGQGEPEALEQLQLALNSLITDLVNHFHYHGAPALAMPLEVAQRIQGFASGVYTAPYGEIWEIPNDLMQKWGIDKIVSFIEAPPLPADFWRMFDLLLSMIDKEGQVTEALEGEGKAHWSGDLAARLQEAARGLIAWKSLRMEESLQYLARLMHHSIQTRLSVDDLAERSSKYPRYVWQAIRDRWKKIDVDISVEIVSGSGQLRERSKQDAIALYANGAGPLSKTTLLERFGEDPKLELQNKISEAQEEAKAASQLQSTLPAPMPGAGTGGAAVAAPGNPAQQPVPAAAAA